MKPLILVTNDDGIESPGLRAAVEAAIELGEVTVVAPTTQKTSMSRSLWGAPEERLHEIDYEINGQSVPAYHADCSPARLIIHALQTLFTDRKPDLLVSGINYGENLGTNIGLSATCGAAFQAAADNIPALAVSLQTAIANHLNHAELDWDAAEHFTKYFARKILEGNLPDDVDVLNVNIPAEATPKTEWKWTRQSHQPYFLNSITDPSQKSTIGDGKCIIKFDESKIECDSDIHAITVKHIVSVTPLSSDSTSRVKFDDIFPFNRVYM